MLAAKYRVATLLPLGSILRSAESMMRLLHCAGCVVYQWDCSSRSILHRLDCSKLAPCSESLFSISIEEHLSRKLALVCSPSVWALTFYIVYCLYSEHKDA